MPAPNLFEFATSELSQDAFICWLASWAKPECQAINGPLHATATAFLDRLLDIADKTKPDSYRSIEVKPQWKFVDILILVNGETAIVIEDKTNTKDHSLQLTRYTKAVTSAFPGYQVAAVYLKTGDQCDYESPVKAGYGCFLRRHFLDILKNGETAGVKNDIFCDFTHYLQGLEDSVQAFLTVAPCDWEAPQWRGFFMALKENIGAGDWGHRGFAGGGSWTFRWHHRDQGGEYLGIDKDELGFRIFVKEPSERKAKSIDLKNKLLAKNDTAGTTISKSKCKLGERMKVATLNGGRALKVARRFISQGVTANSND